jgi:regulator of protease activity HflC (stomatin/prohibitin superfamily)
MIWFAIFIIVAAIAINIFLNPEKFQHGGNINYRQAKQIGVFGLLVLAIALGIFSSITTVSSGHVGVQVVFGKVYTDGYLGEGLHLKNPLAEIHEMSVRTQTYTMSAVSDEGKKKGDDALEVISSDGLTLKIEVSVPYKLIPVAAATVYQKFGEEYEESVVRPSIRSAIREAFSQYTAQEAYGVKREEAKHLALTKLIASIEELVVKAGYKNLAIDAEQVLIRDIKLPESVQKSIQQKLTAQQDAERMDYVIQKETKEADRKRVEAAGIRDFQEIVTKGITQDLLAWKGIEATEKLAQSPNAKVVVIGSSKNGLPIILGDK